MMKSNRGSVLFKQALFMSFTFGFLGHDGFAGQEGLYAEATKSENLVERPTSCPKDLVIPSSYKAAVEAGFQCGKRNLFGRVRCKPVGPNIKPNCFAVYAINKKGTKDKLKKFKDKDLKTTTKYYKDKNGQVQAKVYKSPDDTGSALRVNCKQNPGEPNCVRERCRLMTVAQRSANKSECEAFFPSVLAPGNTGDGGTVGDGSPGSNPTLTNGAGTGNTGESAYAIATRLFKTPKYDAIYRVAKQKLCTPFKLSDLGGNSAELIKEANNTDLTYNGKGTETMACLQSRKAANIQKPKYVDVIVSRNCAAATSKQKLLEFGEDFLKPWSESAANGLPNFAYNGRAYWTCGGFLQGTKHPKSTCTQIHKGCVK